MQVVVQALAAVLIYVIGRLFGGRGQLDAVALMAWLEAVLLLAQLAQPAVDRSAAGSGRVAEAGGMGAVPAADRLYCRACTAFARWGGCF